MSKLKVVRVEWEDSSSTRRVWHSREELAGMTNQKCTSIGFLVHEDDHCVIVAAHKGDEEYPDFSGDMRIPKSAIRKRKYVREQT
jgi:hypothetical protein